MPTPITFDPESAQFELTLILDSFDLLKAATYGGHPINSDDLLGELYRYSTDPTYRADLSDAASFGFLRLLDLIDPPKGLIIPDDTPF
ncbi:MAG: hypothetical protein AAFQ05_00300 [Pseudomonadota bacterium]